MKKGGSEKWSGPKISQPKNKSLEKEVLFKLARRKLTGSNMGSGKKKGNRRKSSTGVGWSMGCFVVVFLVCGGGVGCLGVGYGVGG